MRALVAVAAGLLVGACAAPRAPLSPVDGPVRVKLIAFNDLHGNLEAPDAAVRAPEGGLDPAATAREVAVPAGGAARFAALIRTLAAQNPNHVVTSSGDLVGASPLISALFLDEPTIEAMNLIGVDFNAVGNHEFDRGVDELKRKHDGGCERFVPSLEPCRAGHRFEGARFPFLAANVVDRRTGQPIFPAFGVKTFDGVRVGFIGLTLRGTGGVVDPAGVRDVEFLDEATTINARVAELDAAGVHAVVVLIHEGAFSRQRLREAACPGLAGDLLPILAKLDARVDVVASAHTHQAYVCTVGGLLVTSAASFGRLVTDMDLEIDRASGRVTRKTAVNRIVVADGYGDVPAQPGYPTLTLDPVVAAHVARYAALVAPLAARPVGSVTGRLDDRAGEGGQSQLGAVLADADLAATRGAGARIAFLNPGGVRAPIDPPDGVVTYGALFRAEPFGDRLMTITLSGAQLKAALEQQWLSTRRGAQVLQVSDGFSYAFDASRPVGDRVFADSMRLDGAPIDPAADYRVTVNGFLAAGGDGFTTFAAGRTPVTGIIDVDAAEAYFRAHSPTAASAVPRVVDRAPAERRAGDLAPTDAP